MTVSKKATKIYASPLIPVPLPAMIGETIPNH